MTGAQLRGWLGADGWKIGGWTYTIERTPFDFLPLKEALYFGRLYSRRADRKRRRMRR